jgi:endonuclease-3
VRDSDIHEVIKRLREIYSLWKEPIVTKLSRKRRDPFKVLISCILSLRTQDKTTGEATKRLMAKAATPEEMLHLSEEEISDLIYPVGFYRTKAKNIREICRVLVERYHGKVPSDLEELLKLKGVGRKTANLVLTKWFGLPGICVDTHVHRITNRWGYVDTRTPEETEIALRKKLPKEYWIEINDLLVAFGQNLCRPLSPFCSKCPVEGFCEKKGVTKTR